MDHVEHPKPASPPPRRSRVLLAVSIAVAAAALIYGIHYWIWSRYHEETDDAFIDAHVVMIAPQVDGQVLRLFVDDNQPVRAGDALLEIDPADYRAALGQARADAASAEADARKARLDAVSAEQLYAKGNISRQVYDHAILQADSLRAKAELARKRVETAELKLSYTGISAPIAGKVTRRAVERGAYVRVGQALMFIVPDQVWVTANFKETQLTHMRPGQKVAIRVDAYPRRSFPGRVDSIQAGTGARFSLLPPENATGNYVKVVQRVPVKIVFDDPPGKLPPLAPGMSVVPVVEVH
ncbi:MAG: HlyD family secretion protein [Elusimicrobia bacterium]|nr:HlyD family secretion protein [Elusimicrobiota bacterium]